MAESAPRPIAPGHPLHVNEAGEITGQLPLFMTAREIRQSHQALHGDFHPNESEDALYARKLNEAEREDPSGGPSVAESIRKEGVHSPVHLGLTPQNTYQYGEPDKPEILGGHHRIAVSEAHDPDRLMPVLFHERSDVEGAWSDFAAARHGVGHSYEDYRTPEELKEAWKTHVPLGRTKRQARMPGRGRGIAFWLGSSPQPPSG